MKFRKATSLHLLSFEDFYTSQNLIEIMFKVSTTQGLTMLCRYFISAYITRVRVYNNILKIGVIKNLTQLASYTRTCALYILYYV